MGGSQSKPPYYYGLVCGDDTWCGNVNKQYTSFCATKTSGGALSCFPTAALGDKCGMLDYQQGDDDQLHSPFYGLSTARIPTPCDPGLFCVNQVCQSNTLGAPCNTVNDCTKIDSKFQGFCASKGSSGDASYPQICVTALNKGDICYGPRAPMYYTGSTPIADLCVPNGQCVEARCQ